MRRRFQKGNVRKIHGSWIGRYYENGERRNVNLGRVSEMTKSEAREKLLERIRDVSANDPVTFEDFVKRVYFTICRRKWKWSKAMTTEDRIPLLLVS